MTADSISYTLAFKEAFWTLSLQGYTGTAAFRKLGYNTEVLGFERIHNTTKRIRREARSPEGFHEGARGGVRIPGGGNNQTIDRWTDYYNNDRCQWDLAKLSPNEYYHYITTGEYSAGMLPLWVK